MTSENSGNPSGNSSDWIREDGTTYHLGAKKGEIFNKLLTMGDHARADMMSELFDKDKPVISVLSPRLFKVHSGYYKGVPISIVAIGMGPSMMDFFVREASYLINGPMAIIRLGSCGLSNPELKPGTAVVASKGTMYCHINYAMFDGFMDNQTESTVDDLPEGSAFKKPYIITKPVPSDATLSNLLMKALADKEVPYVGGLNLSAETYYGCQDRFDGLYNDQNGYLLQEFTKLGVDSVEMETHMLMHLSKKYIHPLLTASVAVGVTNRTTAKVPERLPADVFKKNVKLTGVACMDALAEIELPTSN